MAASIVSFADCQVGRRIIEARIDAGLSQCALAELLGVGLQQIWEYEIGQVRPSATRFFEIATALRKTPGWFFRDGELAAEGSSAADIIVR